MREAILRKAGESARLIETYLEEAAPALTACVGAMADRFRAGGRLFTFGNGGSSCDAQHAAVEFVHPIVEKRVPLPAISLCSDTALITAVGNDTDFARIFADQLRRLGTGGDIALGISTSGKAPNVIRAMQAAGEMGMCTVALTGKDGGRLPSLVQHCFVVPSYAIHRIQETHVVLLHLLWDLVHVALGEEDVL